MRIGGKVIVCGDEFEEEMVSATTVETWLTGRREEVEREKKKEKMAKTEVRWRVGKKRSMDMIVLWCARELRSNLWLECVFKRIWLLSPLQEGVVLHY